MLGSPRFKLALSDLGSMLTVSLWIAGSAFATKFLELLTEWSAGQDFGEYSFIVMGIVNIVGVGASQFITDTRTDDNGGAV